jgi:hypothetical protein
MVKNIDMQFFMENLKMKRKKDNIFLTFRSRDLNPRFSVIFPLMIWIFMWSEEPEIKSKQASKRDRNLFDFRLFWTEYNIYRVQILFLTWHVMKAKSNKKILDLRTASL